MTLTNDFIADPCGFEICRNTITEPPCIIPILRRRWNFDRLSAKRRGIPFVGAAREEIEDDRQADEIYKSSSIPPSRRSIPNDNSISLDMPLQRRLLKVTLLALIKLCIC